MQLRPLGKSGVSVTPVVFGAWAIGGWMWGGSEESDAVEAILASIANGVNAIDTAAIYGMGHSERLVARAVAGMRDKVVIATKCGRRWDSAEGSSPWSYVDEKGTPVTIRSNSKPQSIVQECEQSLQRLGTDYIDLYQVHWPDFDTPVEQSMEALAKLRKQGKIRAVGVSNYDVQWLAGASAALQKQGEVLASLQPPYSLIQRGIEKDLLPFCRQQNIGVIVYSPLERGLLTGSVGPDRTFAPGDHRATHKFFTRENRQRVADALAKVKPLSDAKGVSLAQLVVNWTFSEPGITAALVGPNAQQAEHNARAMTFTLSAEERHQIRAAFDGAAKAMTAG